MEIPLHYGDGQISVEIPQKNVSEVIRPRCSAVSGRSNTEIVTQAINRAGEFTECIKGQILGVLVPDGTRDLPLSDIFPPLFPLLANTQKILFFICTGTHNADTSENRAIAELIRTEANQSAIKDYEIIAHDCQQTECISAGLTRRKTEILYNARLREAACFLIFSDIKHHYFAGYSNPIKNFVPGLCAFKTTEQNHSWTMNANARAGAHPWHPDIAMRDNPLAQDQYEAMTVIVQQRRVWAFVTLSSDRHLNWADFGPAEEVTAKAFLLADIANRFTVKPVQKIIISPGGLPNDVDLYIAQRALELTTQVLSDNGEILFAAACPNGIGSPRTKEQFYDKLICPLEKIQAARQQDYQLFSHKPWRFARLIQRLNCLWLYSQIEASVIEKIHMTPCLNPQIVINDWLDQNPNEQILVIDGANKTLLHPTA